MGGAQPVDFRRGSPQRHVAFWAATRIRLGTPSNTTTIVALLKNYMRPREVPAQRGESLSGQERPPATGSKARSTSMTPNRHTPPLSLLTKPVDKEVLPRGRRALSSIQPSTKLEGPAGKGGQKTDTGRPSLPGRNRCETNACTQVLGLPDPPPRGIPQVCPLREILGARKEVPKTTDERARLLPPGAPVGGRPGGAPEPPAGAGGWVCGVAAPPCFLLSCASGLSRPFPLGSQTVVWQGFPPLGPRAGVRQAPPHACRCGAI